MTDIVVVTTSYPEHPGDAQGHFVAAEVRRLTELGQVTVLAPGRARVPLGRERVVSLGGGNAFGFPGALTRLQQAPWRSLAAASFIVSALGWFRRAVPPRQVIAHFLLPCGVPIATRCRPPGTPIEVVVHGSDARLFAALPLVRASIAGELSRSEASLRFVSQELRELVLGCVGPEQRALLEPRSRVQPCAIDLPGNLSRTHARAELGLLADARIAVIVARLVPGKRVAIALEACRRVANLQTFVVGDGPDRARLEARFPEVTFLGHVPRPRALSYLAAANALVSASLHEGAPTVVREARALGTPVVCLEAGDLRRWAEADAGIHVVSVERTRADAPAS